MRTISHRRHRWAISAAALMVSAGVVTAQPQAEEPADSPFSLGVTYSLYSDYVWRGINRSEYRGEGREKPNHQLEAYLDCLNGDGRLWGSSRGKLTSGRRAGVPCLVER